MIKNSKNVFLYWDSEEANIPLAHQMNINNIKRRLEKTDWNIIVTTLDKSSKFYIENLIELPDYFFEIPNKIIDKNSISGNQSDIVRLRLLEKYGGVYFDTSTIFLKNKIEEIRLYDLLMKSDKATLAGYTNFTFTRKNKDSINYFQDAKDGLELGILYAKKSSNFLKILNEEIDKYWIWKTKNKHYQHYPLFKENKLATVSFLNEYHIHYTIFHMIITRDNMLLEDLVTQSTHMIGKENSKFDGPYSISDRFCRDSKGYGSADSIKLLKTFLDGNVTMFDGNIMTLKERVSLFLEGDLFSIPGYMRVEIEKYFNSEDDYKKIESVYRYFYRLI